MTQVYKSKLDCHNCGETYILAWYEGGNEPNSCPFCSASVEIGKTQDGESKTQTESDSGN